MIKKKKTVIFKPKVSLEDTSVDVDSRWLVIIIN